MVRILSRWIGVSTVLVAAMVATGIDAAPDEPILPPPRYPKVDFGGAMCYGVVTELTSKTVTVSRFGDRLVDAYLPEKFRRGNDRQARFVFCPALAAGGGPLKYSWDYNWTSPVKVTVMFSDNEEYRVKDLCVGDHVMISYSRVDEVNTCDRIRIHRRPGGRVPPAPDVRDGGPGRLRWHERQNAMDDLEVKKLPFPEHYEQEYPDEVNELYKKHGLKRVVTKPVDPFAKIPLAKD